MAKETIKLIFLIVVVTLGAWFMDAIKDRLVQPDKTFLNHVIYDVNFEEISDRLTLSGIIVAFLLVIRKLFTRERSAAEALWQGERLLESILRSTQEGLMIRDREGTIIRTNPVVEQWYAYAMPLVGRKCHEVIGKKTCQDCPSQKAMESGEAVMWEVPKIGPGGQETGWLEIYSYPLQDPATGMVSGVIDFVRDITPRRRAEDALRESEARYRHLVEQIPDALFVHDKGRIVDVNQQACDSLGYSREELLQLSVWDIEQGYSREELAKMWEQPTDIPSTRPSIQRRRDGTTFAAEMRAGDFVFAGRRVRLAMARDVTARLQAEEALRESEARYRLLVENIPAVVFKGYADWTLEFFDGKIEELTGYSQEEFNSRRRKWSDVILPEDLDSAKKAFVQALRTTRSYVREYRIRHKEGRVLWIQARGQIICDARGRVDSINGVFFDITAQKEAAEALRRSEARLAEAQRIAHLGNWEWDVQADQSFCSDETFRILGFAPQEFVFNRERFFQCVHPEDREMVRQAGNDALTLGTPYALEYRLVQPDGTVRYVYTRGEVQRDAAGLPTKMIGTIQDITKLKEAQKALAESEKRYRLLAENASDIIWTVDLNLKMTYVSPSVQRQRGYTPEEAMLQSPEEMMTPASLQLARTRLAEEISLEGTAEADPNRSVTMELEFLCKDHATMWAEVTASFLRDSQGRPLEILGVSRDITVRRQLEEQLRQAQRMEVVGRLAGGVAHDFNNLLTAILGYSGLLENHLPADHPARRDVLEIKKAGERAALLTRQLLAFSRRQVLHPRSLDLNQVVRDLGKILQRIIGEDIALEILPGEELGRIMADPGQMEQVVLNLAVNARDAMPQGGLLSIKTANVILDEDLALSHAQAHPGPYILLEVKDNGGGMSAETRAHIFEPFFTTKEVGKGTGLGLSTVYGIIKQSGGLIRVESEPGQGTTIRLYLPRIDAVVENPASPRWLEAHGSGNETILLVEDENMVRQIARRILQRHGYRVLEARDGHEALEIWQQHHGQVQLLLTDLVMPGMSGQELAEHLTSQSAQLKVIFMSGYAEDDIVHQDLANEKKVFLQKPFEALVLTRKVRELLDAA